MNIEFYTYSKRYNSTATPTAGSGTTYTNCTLKDETSIINPVILLTVSGMAVPTIAPTLYNYAYISKFQRYYFVDDWKYANGVWEVSMSVDLLGSFKSGIGAVSTMVERSASSYDLDIPDNMYPVDCDPTITTVQITGFPQYAPSFGTYVLGVVGNAYSSQIGSVSYYAMDSATMVSFIQYMFGSGIYHSLNITEFGEGVFKAMFNPFQYVVSCMWFPLFTSVFGSNVQNVYLGYWNTGISATKITTYASTFTFSATIPNHPQYARGHYLNRNPYTKITCNVPVFGSFPINTQYLKVGPYLEGCVYLDLLTGQATMRVSMSATQGTGGQIFYEQTAMYGVPIQLAQVMTEYNISNPTSFINELATTGIGLLLGRDTDIFGSGASGTPSVVTTGANGSFLNIYIPALVIIEHQLITQEDLAEFGRPLMQVKTINTLSGYIKCSDAHVELPITDNERKGIVQLMNAGFFYE